MTKEFWNAVQDRRTYYEIGKEKIVSDEKIEEIIKKSIKHAPTAFNSQSARVVLLLNGNHDKFWNNVKNELQKIVPSEAFEKTRQKIDTSFLSGYGTILYFEDMDTVKAIQEIFPPYKENFPVWSNQGSGILQYIIWTALENEGLGASLQHYNPLIDNITKKEWNVPESHKLIAQMPFGKPLAAPQPKDFMPIEKRFTVFK